VSRDLVPQILPACVFVGAFYRVREDTQGHTAEAGKAGEEVTFFQGRLALGGLQDLKRPDRGEKVKCRLSNSCKKPISLSNWCAPCLPSASSIRPRSGSRNGRAKSIPRTVAPSTASVGSIVSIAPSPIHSRRVPADRRLSANASRTSHYHARQRITRLLGVPRPAIAPSAPAAPPWQRASGPARPLRRACRRSGRRR
jgi:hypothetical protein